VVIDPAATFHPVVISDSVSGCEVSLGANTSVGGQIIAQSTNQSNRYPLARLDRGSTNARMELWGHPTTGGRVLCYVDASLGYVDVINGSYRIGGADVIAATTAFKGAGVDTTRLVGEVLTGYGIAGSAFNPCVAGVQYYGATNAKTFMTSQDYTAIRVNAGSLEYWNGAAWVATSSFNVSTGGYTDTITYKGGAVV
jgi:hypothetical protein